MNYKLYVLRWMALLFAAMPSVFVKAQIDSSNFVKASILLVSPGNSVYSVCGHAALRMEYPMHQLDYCFSFEVPETSIRLFSALAGKLRQGLSVAPSKDFLCMYQQEGRKVTSYTLGLNFEEKQRLWKLLDECAAYGLYRRYDYIHHGCAVECADIVQRALSPDVNIQYDSMLVSEKMTLRTIYDKALLSFPWYRMLWALLCGTYFDQPVQHLDHTFIIPADLITLWKSSVLMSENGETRPLLLDEALLLEGNEILLNNVMNSPDVVFLLFLIIGLCLTLLEMKQMVSPMVMKCIDYILWSIHFLLGGLMCYIVFFSDFVGTSWNWLLIPFNPFPEIFAYLSRKYKKCFLIRNEVFFCFIVIGLIVVTLSVLGHIRDIPMGYIYLILLLMVRLSVRIYRFAN